MTPPCRTLLTGAGPFVLDESSDEEEPARGRQNDAGAPRCPAARVGATPEENSSIMVMQRAAAGARSSPRSVAPPRPLKRGGPVTPTGRKTSRRTGSPKPPHGEAEWPASPCSRLEEQAVRYVQDWGDQMLAGNPVILHGAEQLALTQVSLGLHDARSERGHRHGEGALEDALLAATRRGHLGMVAHHIRDEECREGLRKILADITDDCSGDDQSSSRGRRA